MCQYGDVPMAMGTKGHSWLPGVVSNTNDNLLGIPCRFSGWGSMLPLQGAQVRFLVGEQRSCMLPSVAKKQQTSNNNKNKCKAYSAFAHRISLRHIVVLWDRYLYYPHFVAKWKQRSHVICCRSHASKKQISDSVSGNCHHIAYCLINLS